jgi:hypothetical protein
MNILFIGSKARRKALFQLISKLGSHQLTHCVEGSQAITKLNQPGRHYDFVIMDGSKVTVSEKDFTLPYAMGPTHHSSDNHYSPSHLKEGNNSCIIDWSSNGVLELKSHLQKKISHALARRLEVKQNDVDYNTFEFRKSKNK